MKRFRIIAVLSLVLTLLSVGAFADAPETSPPSATQVEATPAKDEDDVAIEEVSEPTLDLVFCIDISMRMEPYMPAIKATVQSLIRRDKARYPGHTVRLGLVRHVDGWKRDVVRYLSEDMDGFLQDLKSTRCEGMVRRTKKNDKEMAWSDNGIHRLYIINSVGGYWGVRGEFAQLQGDSKAVRKKNIIVSTAYCTNRPFGSSRANDEWNVRDWLSVDGIPRSIWSQLALQYSGEVIHIFPHKDDTVVTDQSLLALVWDPATLFRFHGYLSRVNIQRDLSFDEYLSRYGKVDLRKSPRLAGFSELPDTEKHFSGGESRVIRYFENHPSKGIYLLRP